jgi:hypothetical protein
VLACCPNTPLSKDLLDLIDCPTDAEEAVVLPSSVVVVIELFRLVSTIAGVAHVSGLLLLRFWYAAWLMFLGGP